MKAAHARSCSACAMRDGSPCDPKHRVGNFFQRAIDRLGEVIEQAGGGGVNSSSVLADMEL